MQGNYQKITPCSINGTQCRMARAALHLGVRDLARDSQGFATAIITRLKAGGTLKPRTVEAIQHALEKAGVEFIDGDKPGVRVK